MNLLKKANLTKHLLQKKPIQRKKGENFQLKKLLKKNKTIFKNS